MIAPSWHPNRNELLQFGWASFFAFGLLGFFCRYWWDLPTLGWVFKILGGYGGLMAMLSPFKVYPLYLLVTLVAMPIGLVVSNLLLGTIYFVIMTPLGFGLRVIGRDALRLKKPSGDSYWVPHERRTDPASYYRQS